MAGAAAEVSTAMARAEATIDTYRRGWQTRVKAAFFPSAAEMFLPGLLHRVKAIDGLRFEAHFEDPGVAGFAALTADYDVVLAHSVDGPEVFGGQGLAVVPLLDEPLDVALPGRARAGGQGRAVRRRTSSGSRGWAFRTAFPSIPCCARSRCRPTRRRSAPSFSLICASWRRSSAPGTG